MMITVAELINKLNDFPADANILFDDGLYSYEIDGKFPIQYFEKSNVINIGLEA